MLFNSIEFAIFVPVVFLVYWFILNKNLRYQNLFLVFASYVFYGWWDWRFLSLIALSSLVDYGIGLALGRYCKQHTRKILVTLSIIVNLGVLGFFKYYNFFIQNFVDAFTLFGVSFNPNRLNIILPVGVSFYTFQTLSYTIDVYRKKLSPTRDIIELFAYVSFFPQLVAGPIERATKFLPQFQKKRIFEYSQAVDGLRQILWGLFKKIVLADNLAIYVNEVFSNYSDHTGSTLAVGACFFSLQLYFDFSGYSDIAIGTGRLFGFQLMKNFAFPEFSRTPAEFWRRWHISLTAWFQEYVLKSLGGFRGGYFFRIRNIVIVFLLIGLWHGANWTYVLFGLLNAIYILPEFLFKKLRLKTKIAGKGRTFPTFKEIVQITFTLSLFFLASIFFRSLTVTDGLNYIYNIFDLTFFTMPYHHIPAFGVFSLFSIIGLTFCVHWIQRNKNHGLESIEEYSPKYLRWLGYYLLILAILMYGGEQQDFVYFQF